MYLVQNPNLLQGYRDGNPNALHQIYLHYAPLLYQTVRRGFSFQSRGKYYSFRGVKAISEQEMFVQETFVRCFSETARTNYDGQRPFLHYLRRTCQNLLLQHHQQNARYQLLEQDEEPSSNEETNILSQQEQFEAEELQHMLTEFLQTCTEREQQVFQALYEEGDSQSQAAVRLGLGRMQIRTSLAKIRKGLLTHLRNSGYLQTLTTKPQSISLLALFVWLLPLGDRSA